MRGMQARRNKHMQEQDEKKLRMQYRNNKYGEPVSVLGYGCMRFSRKGAVIDFDKADRELMDAYKRGVNYFDTAYIYPGSEDTLGRFLEKHSLRDKVNIATKMPQYLVRKADAFDRYFDEELKRLRTDHIDYYLMHMFTDPEEWENLKRLGILSWVEEKKKAGAIRNFGFSYHGNTAMFLKILNDYDWDFCQIQYNYLDETSQAGRVGLETAYAKGIPVIIMEPLRGGRLVNMLPDQAKKLIAENEKHRSPAEWGLRWLWDQPGVTCVLSGMNSVNMVRENCRIAATSRAGEFTDEDFELIRRVKEAINASMKIGCTGCNYCMPCPKGVDIPATFRSWNRMYTENKRGARHEYVQTVGLRKEPAFASQCIKCGKCEKHCPQNLPIRESLAKADRDLLPPYYRPVLAVMRKFKS